MAPEQLHGKAADHRSDIFALGVILYEMLTGRRPFGGGTTAEVVAEIITADPVSVPESLQPALASVVAKCLEKRPEDRFSSAHDLSLILGSVDSMTTAPSFRKKATLERRWPYLAAVVLATIIALVLVLPPEGLFDRSVEEPVQAPVPRIVVLPFENLGSPEDEYFADGVTEEISSRLSAVSGVQVISRSSAMYYKGRHVPMKQIGAELDVGYVLEGTIRWDRGETGHGRVRITPQLIRVADDSDLWSERYDRVLEDIFTVQSDIAEAVISQLKATLLEPERRAVEAHPTDNMEAYQVYLLGNQYIWTGSQERDFWLGVEMLERAVALDPEFAVAHAALSEAHSDLYHFRYDFTPERLSRARASAERALQLRPGLPEAHRALGWYYYSGFRDYDRALAEFSIAAAALPNDPNTLLGVCVVLFRSGRWDEALQALERLNAVDPQGYVTADETAYMYSLLRYFEKAEVEAHRAIAIAPDRLDAYQTSALNYVVWDGSTDRARHLLEAAPEQDSPDIAYMFFQFDLYDRRPDLAMARLESSSLNVFSLQVWYAPRELLECMCLSELGRVDESEQACSLAADQLQHEIDTRPWDYRLHVALGQALARLGLRDEAVHSCERVAELIPIAKDALTGAGRRVEIAKIYTRVGETDTALDLIDELLSIPCPLSVALLRLDPAWDPLRDNPRFQALLEKYEAAR
jgi:serine/threonine-protein kinase